MNDVTDFEPFVQALLERQRAAGLSKNAFARHLGVESAVWSLVSRGKRKPSMSFVGSALRAYPDLLSSFGQSLQICIGTATDSREPAA